MRRRSVYAVYLSMFEEAQAALRAGDEKRLRKLCADVSTRSGLEGSVAMLAMSDAERGLSPRGQSAVARTCWRMRHVAQR